MRFTGPSGDEDTAESHLAVAGSSPVAPVTRPSRLRARIVRRALHFGLARTPTLTESHPIHRSVAESEA
jgi:hypothetical protein